MERTFETNAGKGMEKLRVGRAIQALPISASRSSGWRDAVHGSHIQSRCRSTMCVFAYPLPQRFKTALVTASRTASCRIAHWK
jgi:hypothetical protein